MRNAKFWMGMLVFQVLYGLAVFSITRDYYAASGQAQAPTRSTSMASQPWSAWSENGGEGAEIPVLPLIDDSFIGDDPTTVAQMAEEAFAAQQFDRAADLYQRLLDLGGESANTFNSLGLALHYIGRTDEALKKLAQGVALDASYQRIWLTIGFVNGQAGNLDEARVALTRAVEMDPDNDVGRAAAEMLSALP